MTHAYCPIFELKTAALLGSVPTKLLLMFHYIIWWFECLHGVTYYYFIIFKNCIYFGDRESTKTLVT